MTTTVKNFATPESIVRISNLKVNIKDFTFQLTLGTKAKKQRNFREEVITGKITVELNDWLSKTFKERIKVADDSEQGYKYQETGNLTTGFKTFLSKIGKEFKNIIENKEYYFDIEEKILRQFFNVENSYTQQRDLKNKVLAKVANEINKKVKSNLFFIFFFHWFSVFQFQRNFF